MGEYTIGQALELFLRQRRLKGSILSFQIADVWQDVMGKTIARYTDKIQLINHTLFISTQVAPLRTELLFQKETIIKRVNEKLGSPIVKEVVVQ
jgi:predicted nucleic acid-binding Zn ribbon protein